MASTASTGHGASSSGVARAHRGIAHLFLVIGVVQFFLAGLGAFGEPDGWDIHTDLGRLMTLIALVLVVLAALGRPAALPISIVLLALMIIQNVLGIVGDDVKVLGALHPVNALLVLGAGSLAVVGRPLPFGGGARPHA